MEYKKIGLTDLRVSRVGFGCWAMGGHGYGSVDDEQSIDAVRKALELGINFFDTADVYGFGHSEEVLAEALGAERKNVVIATKFGVWRDGEGKTFRDCSPKRLVEAIDGSLRRLRLDCIPLYQIHWHDGRTPISETMKALQKCQEAGKIRYIGCSNFSFELISEALKTHRVESLQCEYSVARRGHDEDIRRCSADFGMGIIAYGVLLRGLLSCKYGPDARFGENDTRSTDAHFQGEKISEDLKIAEKLKAIGEKYGKSPAQVAIRWVLDNEAVTCAIIGAKKSEQVAANAGAIGWRLNTEVRQELSDAL